MDSDRLSDHSTAEAARSCAETLAEHTRQGGQAAEVVDLSEPAKP